MEYYKNIINNYFNHCCNLKKVKFCPKINEYIENELENNIELRKLLLNYLFSIHNIECETENIKAKFYQFICYFNTAPIKYSNPINYFNSLFDKINPKYSIIQTLKDNINSENNNDFNILIEIIANKFNFSFYKLLSKKITQITSILLNENNNIYFQHLILTETKISLKFLVLKEISKHKNTNKIIKHLPHELKEEFYYIK
jgi:hypothetical protein